jgi:hypothetical protein
VGEQGKPALLVRVKPPAAAKAGRYKGTLTVRRGTAGAKVPLAVEVLPFALMRPSKQYCLNHVPVGHAGGRVPEEADAAQLRPLRDLGIGSLCLAGPPADRGSLETAMRGAQMRGPVLAPAPADGGEAAPSSPLSGANAAGAPAAGPVIRWYALLPESPSAPGALAALKSGGLMVACRMEGDPAAGSSGVDLPIYAAASPECTRLVARKGAPTSTSLGWWSWDASAQSPLSNRVSCGAGLWKSGLSGALVEIDPERAEQPEWALRWEGVRQGILDSRYLTTFYALVRQVKDKDRANRLPAQAEEAVTAALNGVTQAPSTAAAQRFRDTVIHWTIRLQRVVGSG